MILDIAIAFAGTIMLYLGALRWFPTIGLLDFPERYGLTRGRLPYPTGIVAVAAFLILFVATTHMGRKEIGAACAVVLLAVTSLIDDRTPLPSLVRLGIQILCAVIVFVTGSQIYTITNPLGGILKLDSIIIPIQGIGPVAVMSCVFTVVWLLFTINALNWLDGIPGQVSALSIIGFLMLGFLALTRNHEPETAHIAFLLAAIAGASAVFDFPPARVIIGDSGSMFFGLMLGLLGIFSGGKVATVFLALGMPLVDALFVIVRRLGRGQSPLKGGRDHLHHLLLGRGWTERQVILLTAGIGTAFGIGALFLSTGEKAALGVALLLLMVLLYRMTKRRITNAQRMTNPQ